MSTLSLAQCASHWLVGNGRHVIAVDIVVFLAVHDGLPYILKGATRFENLSVVCILASCCLHLLAHRGRASLATHISLTLNSLVNQIKFAAWFCTCLGLVDLI